MLTEAQRASHTKMILAILQDGKLNDEFLPPEEFQIVKTTPYPEWPQAMKDKLARYTEDWDYPGNDE